MYKTCSGMERGTLYHIRNVINRRNVSATAKSNVNASEDFLEAVVIAYILAAVMHYLGMSSFDDMPLSSIISHEVWMENNAVRSSTLSGISRHIVDQYVDLATDFKEPGPATKQDPSAGGVCEHTREVMSLGLLYLDFKDAVREGDGDRVLLLWKYLLLLFKASGRKNYAIEAVTLLTQYHITLPPNLAEQVKWSRFINVHGKPGHNISCDLHTEHLNRLVKASIEGLGMNKSEKAITRVGRAVGVLASITHSYDEELGVPVPSGKHSEKSKYKDIKTIVMLLLENNVLDLSSKEKFESFLTLKSNLIRTLDEKKFKDWLIEKFSIITSTQPELATKDSTDAGCEPTQLRQNPDEEKEDAAD